MRALPLLPVLLAFSANKNQVQLVLGDLGEADCLVVPAPLAREVTPTRKGGVFDALRVYVQLLSASGEVALVNTIVHLVALLCELLSVTQLAFVLEDVALVDLVLARLKHVVTFGAKAHTLKLLLRGHGRWSGGLRSGNLIHNNLNDRGEAQRKPQHA